ncbi:MAG: hypothetical protein ABEI76_06660 [Halobacteriales archaeon]
MSLLARFRQWVRSLFGSSEADSETTTPETDTATAQPDYVCAVCGTSVDTPETSCPLCKSTDIRPADGDDESDPSTTGGLGPATARETRMADDTGAASKLQELKAGGGDPLDRHADRWERLDSGERYRVTLADDSVRHVDSKEQVRAVLLRSYGHDSENEDNGNGDGDRDRNER